MCRFSIISEYIGTYSMLEQEQAQMDDKENGRKSSAKINRF